MDTPGRIVQIAATESVVRVTGEPRLASSPEVKARRIRPPPSHRAAGACGRPCAIHRWLVQDVYAWAACARR